MKPTDRLLTVLDPANDHRWKKLGDVCLEYGAVVVCDPLYDYRSRNRVQRSVEPGIYPVSVLEGPEEPFGQCLAYAQLRFSNEPVKKVIHARFVLHNSFSVTSGLACFMDMATCNRYISFARAFQEQHPDGNLYDDVLRQLFQKNAPSGAKEANWAEFTIPGTANNSIMFRAGVGDGDYMTYWGMGKGNKPACLVIDFVR